MATQLDRALQSKTFFWSFVGVIGLVAAYQIWGNNNLFPDTKAEIREKAEELKERIEPQVKAAASKVSNSAHSASERAHHKAGASANTSAPEPQGEPEYWSELDMETWLENHKVTATGHETKAELLAMVESKRHEPI